MGKLNVDEEGVLTFFFKVEYLCVDHCFPNWEIWKQFVYLDIGRALELDALASSHPVEVPVYKAADVDEIFDAISYSKGKMIHFFLSVFLLFVLQDAPSLGCCRNGWELSLSEKD